MGFVPSLLGVFAVAERLLALAVVDVKLDSKNVQKQFVNLVAREQFIDHPKDVLAIGGIQTSNKPAHAFLLAFGVDPTPIRMTQDGLIVKLQAVVADDRHTQFAGDRNLPAEEVSLQMRVTNRHVTLVEGVAPVILRIEHHTLGASVPGGFKSRFQINIEVPFRRGMALPLHHPIGLVGGDNCCFFGAADGGGRCRQKKPRSGCIGTRQESPCNEWAAAQ